MRWIGVISSPKGRRLTTGLKSQNRLKSDVNKGSLKMSEKDTVPLAMKWDSIDWKNINFKVRQIQTRIVKYSKQKKLWKVRKLQRLLRKSFYATLYSVKRTTTNKGKRTPGVDGQLWYQIRKEMESST